MQQLHDATQRLKAAQADKKRLQEVKAALEARVARHMGKFEELEGQRGAVIQEHENGKRKIQELQHGQGRRRPTRTGPLPHPKDTTTPCVPLARLDNILSEIAARERAEQELSSRAESALRSVRLEREGMVQHIEGLQTELADKSQRVEVLERESRDTEEQLQHLKAGGSSCSLVGPDLRG